MQVEVSVTQRAQQETEYLQCLHDDDTKWKSRDGLPETYPLFYSVFVTMTKAWQEFWFEQLRIMQSNWTAADLKKAWAGLIANGRAFTDFHAPQNGYADFINGVNTENAGIGHKSITTGGNLFKPISGVVSKGGLSYIKVETLDGTKPPPDPQRVNRLTAPHLIHAATNRSLVYLPDGRRRVDPFPQLGGADVPSLLISNVYAGGTFDHNYIRADWTQRAGRNASPYVR